MPFLPHHSLLRVDLPAFHAIDTTSVEDLYGMWSVFSKTSHAMHNGKRYENMSWRLMNRETFCCAPELKRRSAAATSSTVSLTANSATSASGSLTLPALSSSLDSTSDDEGLPSPSISNSECRSSYRRGEKYMAPINLKRIVNTIQESGLQPIHLSLPSAATPSQEHISPAQSQELPSEPTSTESSQIARSSSQSTIMESSASTLGSNPTTKSCLIDPRSQPVGSQASSHTEVSTHSIIRGFVPGGAPSSYRSQTHLPTQPTPILKSANRAPSAAKKKGAMFTIGTSSGEEESSLDSHMHKSAVVECMQRPATTTSATKKQTSFKDEIEIGCAARDSPVFDDSDESDEEVSESAIEDDDDSSDWEDSDDGSGPSSMYDRELFQRVDSRPNLASRRSLLTTALHEPDRAQALADAASRSTPALHRSRKPTLNGPSLATSPTTAIADGGMKWAGQGPSHARPIIRTTSNIQGPMALSPRTTRRNMLSTELTESLRKNLLWERQHRSTGNLAALKRRHTSHDVKNLRQHAEAGPVLSQRDPSQFNNDFFNAGLGEYHTKGW